MYMRSEDSRCESPILSEKGTKCKMQGVNRPVYMNSPTIEELDTNVHCPSCGAVFVTNHEHHDVLLASEPLEEV